MRPRQRPLPPTECAICNEMAIRGCRFIVEGTVYCGAKCRAIGERPEIVHQEYFHPVTNEPYIMHNDPRVPEELRP